MRIPHRSFVHARALVPVGVVLLAGFAATACNGAASAQAPGWPSGAAGVNGQTGAPGPFAQQTTSASTAPVVVNCGPGQQALIRPAAVAGLAVSQVDCVGVEGGAPAATSQPVSYQPDAHAPRTGRVAHTAEDIESVSVVEPPVYQRPAAYRTAEYTPASERVERHGRSWKKSAVIIGSSAGVGAGLGAAIGGKKGALIGAAVGGGSAAIWDQATRRR
jgi:hypothetical protein